jgi:hypothetical protein
MPSPGWARPPADLYAEPAYLAAYWLLQHSLDHHGFNELKTPIFVETCIETISSARSGNTDFYS